MINEAVSPINKIDMRVIPGSTSAEFALVLYLTNEVKGLDGKMNWEQGTWIDLADLAPEVDHTLNIDSVSVVHADENQGATIEADNKLITDNLLTISGRLPFKWASDVYNLMMGYGLSAVDAYGSTDYANIQNGVVPSTGDIKPHEMKYCVLEWGKRRVTMVDSTVNETAFAYTRYIWLYPKTLNFHQVGGQGSEMTFTWTFYVIRDPNPTASQQITNSLQWYDLVWWQIKLGLTTVIPALSHVLFPDPDTNPPPEALENGTAVDWEQKDDDIAGDDRYI